MKQYNFVCGNVRVCFEEYSLEYAFKELQRRLELAASCGVSLPNWLEFEMENV